MSATIRLGACAEIIFRNTTPLGTDETDTTGFANGFVGFVGSSGCRFREIQAVQLGQIGVHCRPLGLTV